MDIFRRKKREPARKYVPPPPPPPLESNVEQARAEFETAVGRDDEIEENRAKLLEIRRDNALGPRFWAAVGERRV